jgi:hypothetical protein
LASSSNSIIGEFSTAGATLRNYYINHGSWNTIGWTHAICPGVCTLDMTANKSWGRMQDFQHDPDPLGAQLPRSSPLARAAATGRMALLRTAAADHDASMRRAHERVSP